MKQLVVIKGAGDVASGIAHRLWRSGFAVAMTELPRPTAIRRTVSFAEAVYEGAAAVEGVEARRALAADAAAVLAAGQIPVVVDPRGELVARLRPGAVVDAILAKRNTGTSREEAPLVIGVGPGFCAGEDVHAVVETMRGHELGRVILCGGALADTGLPGAVGGYTWQRVLRAPAAGVFAGALRIGAAVQAGDVVAYVGGEAVRAPFAGVLRGLLRSGLTVPAGLKVADVDPRCQGEHCFTISDKARAIGGGVLEALLWLGR